MDAVSLFGIVAAAWWGLASTVRVTSVIAMFIQPALRRRAAVRTDQPAVSVVIPVKNMEPGVEAAFASVFSQLYPQFEVVITAAEERSPVIDVGRQVAARFPRIAARFMLGNECFTLNPKVSNLAPAIAATAHDLILIKDANICLADGQLGEFVRNLTPGIGMVCAVPIGLKPETFCAEIECAMMNCHAAPLLMAASVLRLDVGFGKVMLFDRRDFYRVDGIATMAPTFGDDHALAKALARIGLRTVFSASVICQAMGHRTLRDVWDRQLRWMVIRRTEAPLVFFGEVFFGCLFAMLAGALGAASLGMPALPVALATFVMWLASEILVTAAKGWGWSWHFPFAIICREFMIVGLWARAWFTRNIRWAGRPFDVDGPSGVASIGIRDRTTDRRPAPNSGTR